MSALTQIFVSLEKATRRLQIRRWLGRIVRRHFPSFTPRYFIARHFGRLAKTNVLGRPMYVDLRDLSTGSALFSDGVWEEEGTAFVSKILKEGETFVDIGAHMGYYTILAASIVGEKGKVFAFEPDHRNTLVLEKKCCTE